MVPGGFALLPTMGGQTALELRPVAQEDGCAREVRRPDDRRHHRGDRQGRRPPPLPRRHDEDRPGDAEIGRWRTHRPPRRPIARSIWPRSPASRAANEGEARVARPPSPPSRRSGTAGESDRRKRYGEHAIGQALIALAEVGLPAIIRPSFTMGGTGGGIAYNREEFLDIVERGIDASPTNEVLIEESVLGWKEYEMEVVRDKNDNCIIVCSIENIDPMGVHTGDSITVAPALTLTDKEYQGMRDASLAVLREIGVETGGSNVQFAIDPATGRMIVIEMNPRVSRSSALASKATGFPIAKVAAKLAVGYTLDEIANDITGGATPASFEPSIDYVVTKIPRFAFEKFPGRRADADHRHEVGGRGHGHRPLLCRIPTEGPALPGDRPHGPRRDRDRGPRQGRRSQRHQGGAGHPDAGPAPQGGPGAAPRRQPRGGARLLQDRPVVPGAAPGDRGPGEPGQGARHPHQTPGALRQLKAAGFSDARLAVLAKTDEDERARRAPRARRPPRLQAHRHLRGRVPGALPPTCTRPTWRPSPAPWWTRRSPTDAKKVIILGGGPEPDRPGHRVRLLLLPRLLRADRGRVRDHHGQLQPGDGLHRLRHLGPALLRAADGGGCPRDHRDRAPGGHAPRRHRAVRRADPAEARPCPRSRRRADPRHLLRTPSTSPRIATSSSASSTSSG